MCTNPLYWTFPLYSWSIYYFYWADLQISSSQLAPTNLTSIVAWISGSDVVTVRKAPPGGPQNRNLDVLVGTQRRFFEGSSHMWQDYNRKSHAPLLMALLFIKQYVFKLKNDNTRLSKFTGKRDGINYLMNRRLCSSWFVGLARLILVQGCGLTGFLS